MIQIGILSLNREYAQKLAGYLSLHLDSHFEIIQFLNQEALYQYILNHTLNLLITQEKMKEKLEYLSESFASIMVLYLSENRIGEHMTSIECTMSQIHSKYYLNQYSSCQTIVEHLLKLFPIPYIAFRQEEKTDYIVGVYSPIQRCLKTSVAVSTGILCSGKYKKKTLLISVDSFSWLKNFAEKEILTDLSDLIFTMGHQENIDNLLTNAIYHFQDENLDYIIPPLAIDDFHAVTGKVLVKLVNAIRQLQIYDVIIVDAGMILDDILYILSLCDVVFIPQLQDVRNEIKLQNFRNYMFARGGAEILEHFVPIPLHNRQDTTMPFLNRSYFHQLLQGDIGEVLEKGLECFNT